MKSLRGESHEALPEPISRRSQVFWRRSLYGLLGALAVGFIIYVLQPQPLVVDLATVARGDFQVTINAEGKTRVRDRYGVTAPVTGDLQRLSLQVGDRVRAGDTIAQIDPLPLNNQVKAAQGRLSSAQAELAGVNSQRPKPAAVAQAQARIEAAQAAQAQAQTRVEEAAAALTQAQRERDRLTTLYEQGGVARQELEARHLATTQRQQELTMARQQVTATAAEVEAARAARRLITAEQRDPDYLVGVYQGQIAAIEAELVSLADAARRTTVTAPAAGQVLTVIEPNRRYVTAGTPLLTLGDPKKLELVIDILSTDAVQVRPGARVIVNRWGGDQPLKAQVRLVEPAAFTQISALGIEEQRVNIIADLHQPPPTLGDGFRVEAQIVLWEAQQVLQVPISALFRCEPDWCAFVVDQGRAQRRSLGLGRRNDQGAVVESGLAVGDQVILYPGDQVGPGRRVRGR